MNDCQQMATSLVPLDNVSMSVLATVVSVYPHRSEAMCDAGALAMSKDTGPWAGYGRVVYPPQAKGWDLGRISQEHGTLVHRPGEKGQQELKVGDVVHIVPQHACLVCASFPWMYVVDPGDTTVKDVWVPWKGW
jgi:D-serine deaminase-like pyridoxal phosphate-dependent protein